MIWLHTSMKQKLIMNRNDISVALVLFALETNFRQPTPIAQLLVQILSFYDHQNIHDKTYVIVITYKYT